MFERSESGLMVPRRIRDGHAIERLERPSLMACGPAFFGGGNTADEYTIFLWHANNLSSDETGKTIVAHGDASISTSTYQYGGSALSTSGAGWVSSPHVSAFNLSSTQWCVEGWTRIAANPSGFYGLIGKRATAGDYSPFSLYIDSAGKLGGLASATGSSWQVNMLSPNSVPLGTFFHWALAADGVACRLFLEGNQESAQSFSSTLMTNGSGVTVNSNTEAGSVPVNGFTDEVRISDGNYRYNSNFTPSGPFSL